MSTAATLLVVDGVFADPVALWVDGQREHLGQLRALQQQLAPWRQRGEQVQLHLVQLEQFRVLRAIERWVREQQLVGQLSITVRNRSAEAKSSTACVDSTIDAFRLRQVFNAS
ncbi:MAG: hypothetical protein U0Q11_24030 [Vicinamibacterales bacterium]